MADQRYSNRTPRCRPLGDAFSAVICIFLVCVLTTLNGCVREKMSVQEASRLSVAMSRKPFVPPPRRASDILAMLDTPGVFDPEVTRKWRTAADMSVPETTDPAVLAEFYSQRGLAAQEMGRYGQELKDLRKALHYNQQGHRRPDPKLLLCAGVAELTNGNFKRGMALLKQSHRLKKGPSTFFLLANSAYKTGDLEAGDQYVKDGLRFMDQRINRPLPARKRDSLAANRERLLAGQYEIRGQFRDAEAHQRKAVEVMRTTHFRSELPYGYFKQRIRLAKYMAVQGKLVEAELEARQVLKEALGHGGLSNAITGEITDCLGKIFLEQGRITDAETVIGAAIRILADSGMTGESYIMSRGFQLLGEVAVAKGDFQKAAAQFQQAQSGMGGNRFLYDSKFARDPDVLLTGLMTGRVADVSPRIQALYERRSILFGPAHYKTAEALALRALARAEQGRISEAIADYAKAMPVLFSGPRRRPLIFQRYSGGGSWWSSI